METVQINTELNWGVVIIVFFSGPKKMRVLYKKQRADTSKIEIKFETLDT